MKQWPQPLDGLTSFACPQPAGPGTDITQSCLLQTLLPTPCALSGRCPRLRNDPMQLCDQSALTISPWRIPDDVLQQALSGGLLVQPSSTCGTATLSPPCSRWLCDPLVFHSTWFVKRRLFLQ